MIPEGYIAGLDCSDGNNVNKLKSHLYKGDHANPGLPMCKRGMNRGKYGYFIWCGQLGLGICKVCMKRALAGKDGIEFYGDSTD